MEIITHLTVHADSVRYSGGNELLQETEVHRVSAVCPPPDIIRPVDHRHVEATAASVKDDLRVACFVFGLLVQISVIPDLYHGLTTVRVAAQGFDNLIKLVMTEMLAPAVTISGVKSLAVVAELNHTLIELL